MKLQEATWPEIETYLERSSGIIIPAGSTEQHGPMGLIGTDALCAEAIAHGAGERADACVAPTLSYTPAPFNMAFPGTISISEPLFRSLMFEILDSIVSHGFRHIYVLNGHGANLAVLNSLARSVPGAELRVQSWWNFSAVKALRQEYFGEWEGMHATPSEIAITQATHRIIPPGETATPPEKLSSDYIAAHTGDRHGPPAQHRARFPDGRVGSHSALATPAYGKKILQAAIEAVAQDYAAFTR